MGGVPTTDGDSRPWGRESPFEGTVGAGCSSADYPRAHEGIYSAIRLRPTRVRVRRPRTRLGAQITALDRPAFVPRTTGRRQEMTGTAEASNPQVRNPIRPTPQVARSAPRTLSRWRRVRIPLGGVSPNRWPGGRPGHNDTYRFWLASDGGDAAHDFVVLPQDRGAFSLVSTPSEPFWLQSTPGRPWRYAADSVSAGHKGSADPCRVAEFVAVGDPWAPNWLPKCGRPDRIRDSTRPQRSM